ncbi:PadR family transcriptional regulator [Mycetocola sp.]|uniref:PadR family transcriptional regulator n=1 Tax=Mycetocola sp. TaxID=1871042 RepID=UPI003989A2F0
MTSEQLPPDVVRAALPIAVMALLARQPAHGYALLARLQELGFTRTQGGALYPLLKRFEDAGLVTHEWLHDGAGPGRKEFALTPSGHSELTSTSAAWNRVTDILTNLITAPGKTSI